jgi:hypothetical protein
MKTPEPDDETVLTGRTAAERMAETWDDMGLGKVEAEVIGPWLIINRKLAEYRTFISLVDEKVVTILNGDATTRHVPKEYRPDDDASEATVEKLGRAFDGAGGGMYPTDDAKRFQIGFKEDGERKYLNVRTDGEGVWISDA